MNIVLGLTWMDSAKVLAISFGLLLVTVAALRELRGRPRWLGQVGFVVTGIALVWLAISVAVEFWTFPWGSYELDFDRPLPKYGGLAQTIGSLTLATGFLFLAIDLGRNRVLPIWIGVALVVGALTTIYLTPVLPIPGLAWLLLGAALLRKSRSKLVPHGT